MPSRAWSLEDVRQGLLELRAEAGSPSYTEISRRISADRAARGLPASECHVARATVHHAFQTGRRRINEDLLREIIRALAADATATDHWVRVNRSAQRRLDASCVVSVHDQLPAPTDPSVDRAIADDVLDLLRHGVRTVVLEGMSGSGKTQLALQVARRLLIETTSMGVLHVDLRGYHPEQPPVDPTSAMEAAVRVMRGAPGRGPSDATERRRAYDTRLAEHPRVLVLDDAVDAGQVSKLLPRRGRCVTLVTSRTTLDLPGAHHIVVPSYTWAESTTHLRAVVGHDRVEAEPEAASALLDATAHLPLSVALAASRVRARPDWTMSDHVDLVLHRLSGLRLDEPLHANLTRSYVALSPAARSALRLLAFQPFPTLSRLDVPALLGVDSEQGHIALAELTSHHLVSAPSTDGVRMHPLVQTFGLDQSMEEDSPRVRNDAVARVADHFVAMAWAGHLHQHVDSPRAVPTGVSPVLESPAAVHTWLEDSPENLLLLAANAWEWGLEDRIVPLSAALAAWLNMSGRYRDGVELHELALDAARRSGEHASRLVAQLDLGMSLARLNDWEHATGHLQSALAGLDEIGHVGQARAALNALAIRDAQQGRDAEAVAKFTRCADLSRACGELTAYGSALDNTAIVLRRLHRYAEALDHHHRAAGAARECANAPLEARSLVNAAALLISLDRPDEALSSAAAGLLLAEAHGIVPVAGYGEENMASALRLLGRPLEAAEHHRVALRIAGQLEDEHLRMAALIGLGEDLLSHDPSRATEHLDEGLALAKDLGEPLDRVRAWHGLAVATDALEGQDAGDLWRRRCEKYVSSLAAHERRVVGDWLAQHGS